MTKRFHFDSPTETYRADAAVVWCFDDRFTLPTAGVPYPTPSGLAPTDAFSLQGRSVSVTITQRL